MLSSLRTKSKSSSRSTNFKRLSNYSFVECRDGKRKPESISIQVKLKISHPSHWLKLRNFACVIIAIVLMNMWSDNLKHFSLPRILVAIIYVCSAVHSEQLSPPSCSIGESESNKSKQGQNDEDNYFEDVSGFKVHWNDPEDGWDEAKREDLLTIHSKNLLQPRYVPKLTKTGFHKLKIPDELFTFLLEQRNVYDLKWENCGHGAHQNCDRRLDNGELEPKRNVQLIGSRKPNLVKKVIQQTLEPLLEKWSGIKLTPTLVSKRF